MASSRPAPGEQDMGAFEVINTVLGDGVSLAGLVVAIATWRSQRARPPRVELERGGVKVTVSGASPREIATIAEALGLDAD